MSAIWGGGRTSDKIKKKDQRLRKRMLTGSDECNLRVLSCGGDQEKGGVCGVGVGFVVGWLVF